MQPIFSSLPLFDSGSLIAPLLSMVMGIAMITFDLSKRRRERGQGERRVGYQRFWIVLGAILISMGLLLFIFTDLITDPISHMITSDLLVLFSCHRTW